MAIIDWNNQGLLTAFPYEADCVVSSVTQNRWVSDFGAILGPKSTWSYGDAVTTTVSSPGGNFQVVVVAGNSTFTFTFVPGDSDLTTKWVTANEGNDYGVAFLTSGNLNAAAFAISGTQVPTAGLEQTTITTLKRRRVTSIKVANEYGAIYKDYECGVNVDVSENGYVEASGALIGNIDLLPGRHISVALDATTSRVRLGLADTPTLSSEAPCQALRPLPDGYSANLEPQCVEMLFTINGVGPDAQTGSLRLESGDGVIIENTPGFTNKLTVTVVPTAVFGPAVSDNGCPETSIPPDPFNVTTGSCNY